MTIGVWLKPLLLHQAHDVFGRAISEQQRRARTLIGDKAKRTLVGIDWDMIPRSKIEDGEAASHRLLQLNRISALNAGEFPDSLGRCLDDVHILGTRTRIAHKATVA